MYAKRLEEALPRTREAIEEAALRVGRDPADVTLIAVTKAHPVAAIHAALDAGLVDLGENRVEELLAKVEAVGAEGVRWHMIGHVQSRKAGALVGLTHRIHSMDRASFAERLGRLSLEAGLETSVLVQVNTSGEGSKGGFPHATAVEDVLAVSETPGLRVEGLMTMAPFVEDEATLRTAFRRLREVSVAVRRSNPGVGAELSMGMTNDLRFAVEEGSTMVRVGTALFGPRAAAKPR